MPMVHSPRLARSRHQRASRGVPERNQARHALTMASAATEKKNVYEIAMPLSGRTAKAAAWAATMAAAAMNAFMARLPRPATHSSYRPAGQEVEGRPADFTFRRRSNVKI